MFDDDVQEIETREVAAPPMVNANQSMMQVRSSFATAVHVQKPRNLKEVEKEFLFEADLAGASFYYGWGVQDKGAGKNKAVEGPSIGLAKSLMRCWGNCAVEMLPVSETPQAYFFTAAFIDLEKGVTITRQFRQSKNWQVYGKMDAERKEDVRFQIGQSKAIRNVIRAALPDWMVQRGLERAKQGEMAKLDKYIEKNGIEKAREVITEELKKFGVTLELILAKLERPTFAAITKEDMVLLKGDIQALRTGQDSLESLYPFKDAVSNGNGNGAAHPKSLSLKEDLKAHAAKNNPAAKSAEPAANSEQRKIVAAAGLDATAMLANGFEFRYIVGENGDHIVDQKTGEAIPLKTANGGSNEKTVKKSEKSSPAAPDEVEQAKNHGGAPYPEDWAELRKGKVPEYDVYWNDPQKATDSFLKNQLKAGRKEAAYEIAFRKANQ